MKTIFSIFLLFLSFTAFGQKIEFIDYNGKPCKEKNAVRKKIYSVITRNDSTFYRVQDCSMWNEQKIDNVYLDEKCTILHGEQREYSRVGKLVFLTQYQKGVKHGSEIDFFPSGTRRSVDQYYRGTKMNASKSYYPSGALRDSVFYVNGDPTGSDYYYFETGEISSVTPYKNGKIDGVRIGFTEEGDTSRIDNYIAGKLEGLSEWRKNGKPFDVEYYKGGKLEGTAKYYYENGNLAEETVYANDEAISCINYYENGEIRNRECEEQLPPEYPGGMAELKRFLGERLVYPQSAQEEEIQGKVFLKFIVETDGSVKNIEIARGAPDCPECDAEAMRVVSLMPKWTVHPYHNRVIARYYNLPVIFKLQ